MVSEFQLFKSTILFFPNFPKNIIRYTINLIPIVGDWSSYMQALAVILTHRNYLSFLKTLSMVQQVTVLQSYMISNYSFYLYVSTYHSMVIVSKSLGSDSKVADISTSESLMQFTFLSLSSNLNI